MRAAEIIEAVQRLVVDGDLDEFDAVACAVDELKARRALRSVTDARFDQLDVAVAHAAKTAADLVDAELGDAAVELAGLRRRLESVEAGVVGRFDSSGQWALSGYRSAATWLADKCREYKPVAQRRVGLARKLRDLPAAAEAFAGGEITTVHVERIAKGRSKRRGPLVAEAEELLVGAARDLVYDDFVKAVEYFEQRTEPGEDPHPNPGQEERSCHSSKLLDGCGKVDATLDAIGFAAFDEALRRIEQELFEADWAACVAEFGTEAASVDKLWRTASQRRADALVEMAHRAETAPKDGKRPEPLVVVHIDEETFTEELKRQADAPYEHPAEGTSELHDGTVVHPANAVAAAVEGHVRRVVFRSPGVVINYGRAQRLFTGALRQLLSIRDRVCDGPGCDIDARHSEADHVHDWNDGGHTDEANGRCRCRWHHRHKHRFRIIRDPVTGRTTWHRRT
ncbi:MAG: DUF222 domain-containing protein [Actinomycetota bacterium]|nr:DUF222 domain-containing protein [Actinomycetota bacterium]